MRLHFDSVYGQSLITVSVKYPEMKLIGGVISLRSISFRVINDKKTLALNEITRKDTSAHANISLIQI